MNIKITDESLISVRLDKYLTENLKMTRNKVQELIEENHVLVNDKVGKSNYRLKLNDIIEVEEADEKDMSINPENIPLDIVYEDEDLLVVNKPSGMVVHPAPGNYSHTLVNALMYHCNHNLSTINGHVRPGIVHRIDADTSGLLLVAKNDQAHLSLSKQLSEKTTTRKYLALVEGVIQEDTATIDAPIGRDKNDRKKMSITVDNSKDAITHIRVLERYPKATLIECQLETGRTHQIRVHMKYINHPIINDNVYGKNIIDPSFGQMLHAKTIGFIHPRTNEYMEFSREPGEEFNKIVEIFKNKH